MPVPAHLKRKATDDPQSPSNRPSRRVAVESRARVDPQPTTRGPVEPNSIEAILRHHSRDRLYVPPVAWTSMQLRLLNCRFTRQQAGPLKEQVKDPPQSQRIGSDPPVRNSRRRHTPSDLCRSLLACWPSTEVADYRSYERLPFYFRRQPAANVWTEGVFSRKSAPPSLAYVTFDGIRSHRSNYVHNSPAKPFNEPVTNIRNRKLRSLQPLKTVEDPYIMGVLIALAQAQWRQQQAGTEQHGDEAAECSIKQRDGGHTANGTSSRTPSPPRCIPDRGPHDCSQGLRVCSPSRELSIIAC
ncbi:hypothetical protein BP00DRAFT_389474 [Aspergillus indologenus CBS 114.80]|uniref:Uncharacterized protein n=1 Tax=Aspergillus indologenus CBS 114.80 TaxID=1450541 RepID=A0A2V5IL79_9EURO|nr:hypothetical protein BP00DRAFT_389474 [Aspergillus indologenus CBS 114.80]